MAVHGHPVQESRATSKCNCGLIIRGAIKQLRERPGQDKEEKHQLADALARQQAPQHIPQPHGDDQVEGYVARYGEQAPPSECGVQQRSDGNADQKQNHLDTGGDTQQNFDREELGRSGIG